MLSCVCNARSLYLLDTTEINRLKRVRRLTDVLIASKINRSPSVVSRTIHNDSRGEATQRAIARVLRVKFDAIATEEPIDTTQQGGSHGRL